MDAGGSRGIKPKGEEQEAVCRQGVCSSATITYKYFVFSLYVLLS